jgi:MFS family permease
MDALKTTLGIIFLLSLFISFAGAFIDSTFAYFVMDRFGLTDAPSAMPLLGGSLTMTGPGVMGVVFATIGVIGVLCQGLLVGRIMAAIGEVKTIVAGLAFVGTGLLLLLVSVDLLTLIIFIAFIGIGSGLVNPSLNTLVSKKTDADNQGAMLGVLGSFNSLGRAIGPPAGGLLYMVNMALPYVVSAGISAIAAVILYAKARGEPAGAAAEAKPAIKV